MGSGRSSFFDTTDLALNKHGLLVRAAGCSSAGGDLSGEQQTKTKTALEFFSRSLKATADASS